MSLKHNVIANYVSQLYVALIAIVVVPVYIRLMGTESYGLVGFFAMLLAWFNLLDMGMTPTVARETARHQGGASSAMDYRRLIRALEGIFVSVALLGGTAILLAGGWIGRHWLKAEDLPPETVVLALHLMAGIIALRWTAGLYRGVISGSQRLVWLSGFNIAVATARFVAVLPVLWWRPTPETFFAFQLGVALLELAVLYTYANRLLPRIDGAIRWDWQPLKPVLRFAMTVAFTSSVWVLLTQVDKMVLSGLLPLTEYGYFSLAVVAASAISILSGPVTSALLPRLTRLEAEGRSDDLIRSYRGGTQLVTLVAGSAAITVAAMAKPLLLAWTGDPTLAAEAAPILSLYALGNGVLAVSAFPYFLQYAKGDLKLHLIGNLLFVLLLVPLIIWAARRFGAEGAGLVWLGMNLATFALWLPFVHHRFVPGLNLRWYGLDTLPLMVPALAMGYGLSSQLPVEGDRMLLLLWTAVCGLAVIGTAAAVLWLLKRAQGEPFLHWGT